MSSTEPFADRVSADGADAAYQLLRSAGIADAKAYSMVYEEPASDYEDDGSRRWWGLPARYFRRVIQRWRGQDCQHEQTFCIQKLHGDAEEAETHECTRCGTWLLFTLEERNERIREAVRNDPEFMAGVREGLAAHQRGETGTPWSEVEKELGIE